MEDFLKNKLNELENNFQDDWNVFEQKLERALFFKRLRIGAAMSLFLIATSIGIFGTSSIVDFNSVDDAPFGVYTEKGFETSGSKSEWKGIKNNANDQVVLDETKNISAVENIQIDNLENVQSSSIVDNIKNISNPSEDVSLIQEGQISGSEPAGIIEVGIEPENTATANDGIASANSESFDKFERGVSGTNLIPGASPISNAPADEITTASIDGSGTVASQTEVVTQNAPLGESDVVAPEVGEVDIISLVASNTVATEEDLYDLQELDLKSIKLELPTMNSLSNAEIQGLQIRMPVPAFKQKVADKGPFISPLQNKSLWEYSLKVYPNFTFRKFRVDQDKANYIHRDFVDQVRASESGGFSLNIGLEVSRRIGLATYLKGGVEYISYNHSANFDFTNYRSANIDEKTGAIKSYALLDEPNQVVINDKNTYHYLNLPLSISYQPWASDHIRLNMEAGVSYMYFVAARGASIDYRTLEIIDLSERDFKNSLGSINLKVGATYYISPQFNLGFEPTFVYFTNTIYTDEYPFEVIPYSVGLNLKLQVKLN